MTKETKTFTGLLATIALLAACVACGPDSGTGSDASSTIDGSANDASVIDAQVTDAQVTDAQVTDARLPDATMFDAMPECWVRAVVASGGAYPYDQALVLDSAGNAHGTYFNDTANQFRYITNSSGSWADTLIQAGVGWQSSIDIDTSGTLHASYYDATTFGLAYATKTSAGAWNTGLPLIDADDIAGRFSSLTLDPNGAAHVVYEYFDSPRTVRYAQNTSGSFAIATIPFPLEDVTPTFASSESAVVDSDGKMHVAYYEFAKNELKYATNASGSWVFELVDNDGDVGRFNSIGIDGDGFIHMAYEDSINRSLKYATNATGSFVASTIDPAGRSTSLAIDTNNKVHISYQSSIDLLNRIKYATNASGSWKTEEIDDAFHETQLVLDPSNVPHVLYKSKLNNELSYAKRTGCP